MGSHHQQIERINQALGEMYGTDLVNAKRVINTKLSKNRPNPENLTLAERILLNRRKGTDTNRRDTPSDSVDISDLTDQNDERRTPTPEPTRNNRSPVRRQESKRSINSVASEQPGPSNRKSSTPPLPPIKTASPRPESKVKTPSRQSQVQSRNRVQSRRETPVLPPIARKDSRADSRRQNSRVSVRSDEGVQPPKDMREFDPNLGVGEVEHSPTPKAQPVTEPEKKKEAESVEKTQAEPRKAPETKPDSPVKPKSPEKQVAKGTEKRKERSPERPKSSDKTTLVPVVAAAATSSERVRPRSRSRSRSRRRSRSKSRSRSRSRRRRKSSSRSRSRSRRRSRRSKSRKHRRSSSSSRSSSPRRRRRYSSSPMRRHISRSRGRSRSRRRSFDYDYERAKSIVRGLSRMDTYMGSRYRSPSIEYKILGGNGGFWPPARPESSRKKKKIIIVQGGPPVQPNKRRNHSSSDSDISFVVKNMKAKSKGHKGKVRKAPESEDSESDSSRSRSRGKRGRKKNKKHIVRIEQSESSEESDGEEQIVDTKKKTKTHKTKGKDSDKKKNIRFDLKNVPSKNRLEKTSKKVTVESDNEFEPELDENENIPGFSEPVTAVPKQEKKGAPVLKKQKDVNSSQRLPTPDSPLPSNTSSRNQTPQNPPTAQNPQKQSKPQEKGKNPQDDEKELHETLEQLDKRSDFELEQLKGGNQRKLPPDVNLDMKKKIFSKEFQQSINNFLES